MPLYSYGFSLDECRSVASLTPPTDGSVEILALTLIPPSASATTAECPPDITALHTAYGAAGIAQNTWIQINGFGLTPSEVPSAGLTWSTAPSFASGEMPTELCGVAVKVNGKPAFPYFVSPTQLNVLTPLDSTLGPVQASLWQLSGHCAHHDRQSKCDRDCSPADRRNYIAASQLDGYRTI